MKVALRRTSLIDFPGRVAAVAFLPGCNFRCPYCQNAPLVAPPDESAEFEEGLVEIEEVEAFLERRAGLITGLVISGGEPLLHRQASRLAAVARRLGLAVKLDTNGYFPERISDLAPDYVALDFKTAPSAYGRVAPGLPDAGSRMLESLATLRALGDASGRVMPGLSNGVPGSAPRFAYEVRITCAPGLVDRPELEEMLGFLEPGDPVILQNFRPGGCLDAAWDSKPARTGAEMTSFLGLLRSRVPAARLRGLG